MLDKEGWDATSELPLGTTTIEFILISWGSRFEKLGKNTRRKSKDLKKVMVSHSKVWNRFY